MAISKITTVQNRIFTSIDVLDESVGKVLALAFCFEAYLREQGVEEFEGTTSAYMIRAMIDELCAHSMSTTSLRQIVAGLTEECDSAPI